MIFSRLPLPFFIPPYFLLIVPSGKETCVPKSVRVLPMIVPGNTVGTTHWLVTCHYSFPVGLQLPHLSGCYLSPFRINDGLGKVYLSFRNIKDLTLNYHSSVSPELIYLQTQSTRLHILVYLCVLYILWWIQFGNHSSVSKLTFASYSVLCLSVFTYKITQRPWELRWGLQLLPWSLLATWGTLSAPEYNAWWELFCKMHGPGILPRQRPLALHPLTSSCSFWGDRHRASKDF